MTEQLKNQTKISSFNSSRFSIAPMLDWTDRHCRFFHRLMTRKALLYTEMIHAGAILFGEQKRFLTYSDEEHPLALQLGGADPSQLAQAAKIAEEYGFDEINLNVGCPSDRVQNGSFGACLMLKPTLVGDCVSALKAAVSIPVTVKCRIGVDDQDVEEALDHLTAQCVIAKVDGLIVHARKAWLQGLSPKENRDIPPLDYGRVYRLKEHNKDLAISINGGVKSIEEAKQHLIYVDGVMVGRAAYQEPSLLLTIDDALFDTPSPFHNGFEVLQALEPYISRQLEQKVRLHSITRHILGLFNGQPGARLFRRHLATEGCRENATYTTIREAMAFVQDQVRPTM